MTWRLYALLSGGAFVATYLVSGPRPPVPVHPPAHAATTSAPRANTDDSDIQALADRLQARVRAEMNYKAPTRNPFAFGVTRQRVEPRQVIAPNAAPPAFVPAPVRPSFSLSGIASDRVDGAILRTAIFSAPTGVSLVREGDIVGGTYRVVSIGEDSVTLESTSDGSSLRMSLSNR